jgi:hypothetical protein
VALRPGTDLTGNADWTHIRTMMAQRLLCSTSASGTKRTSSDVRSVVANGRKADIAVASTEV